MTALHRQIAGGLFRLVVFIAALIFLPAGMFDYWQGWLFLIVFVGSAAAITIDLVRNDPELLARRIRSGPRAEKETSQKIILSVLLVVFVAAIVVPVLDHRFGGAAVHWPFVLAGDALVALGYLGIHVVFRVNHFASATIEIGAGQSVVSSGPYAWVRHPMYGAALVMFLGVPLALGSWRGLGMIVPIALVLGWRLLDEERFLERNLPGYMDYTATVRYRLVPGIW